MRYIKTDWNQWHDTHASLLVQADWHRLLVPENWSVCMALKATTHQLPPPTKYLHTVPYIDTANLFADLKSTDLVTINKFATH